MAIKNNYAAEIKALYSGYNDRQTTKADDKYRQEVLGETIRSNFEKERIQRETLQNQLSISGSYRSRATDKTGDLEKSLDTQEYGIDRSFAVGMDRNDASRYGSDVSYEVGMDSNEARRDVANIGRSSGLDRIKSNEFMQGEDLAWKNLSQTRGFGHDKSMLWAKGSVDAGLMSLGGAIKRKNMTLGSGLKKDETVSEYGLKGDLQDKRYGLEGGLIKERGTQARKSISHEYEERDVLAGKNFKREQKRDAYSRETNKILQDDRLSSTEKMNALDNITRITVQGMSDKTKIEVEEMGLQAKREWIKAEFDREDVQRDQAIKGSAAQPITFERKEGIFGVDEDTTLANVKSWDTSQTMGDAKNPSVYSKAITLAKSKDSSFTNQVITNYEDAWKKVNAKDMWQMNFSLAPYKKKHDAQNAMIKTRLRGLYSAQGYKKEWINSKLKELKNLNLRTGKSPYKY
tara:strand:- start:2122 stop:3501 length:1380 start_codon:yes stop_codon:yes gene_type:complete